MRSQIAYLVAGFLLGNGFPHFVFGVAGQIFRSPFARETDPIINILWGLTNFIAASFILFWLSKQKTFDTGKAAFLLTGFWLAVAMFGFFISSFIV